MTMGRRTFLQLAAAAPMAGTVGAAEPRKLKVWVWGCAHCAWDYERSARLSIADAIADSEADFPDWDFALSLGDYAASQGFPADNEGLFVRHQLMSGTLHPREAIYTIGGNHDRGPVYRPDAWLRRYVDPMGENTATSGVNRDNFPYPVDGSWDHYEIAVGNLRFLMVSDVIRPNTSLRGINGGDPGGVVNRDTYFWWIDRCDRYRESGEIVITGAHYLPEGTTACTTHGSENTPKHGKSMVLGASAYLAYMDDFWRKPLFREYLAENPGACAMWLGAHNHLAPGWVDEHGHGLRETIDGCDFWQCAALTNHYGALAQLHARSHLFTFTDGSDQYTQQVYYHVDRNGIPKGFGEMTAGTLGKTVSLA